MTWLEALCLSVPPSVALVLAARVLRAAARDAWQAGEFIHDAEIANRNALRENMQDAVEKITDAWVEAARYAAKYIPAPPQPLDKPGNPNAFDRWLATDGKGFPDSVKDQCAWAYGRLKREESEDQGDDDDARRILDHFAPGLANTAVDEYQRELAGR